MVDPATKQVSWSGRPVELSPREFAVLYALASRPDTVLSKDELLRLAWGRRAGREPQRRRGLRRLPAP